VRVQLLAFLDEGLDEAVDIEVAGLRVQCGDDAVRDAQRRVELPLLLRCIGERAERIGRDQDARRLVRHPDRIECFPVAGLAGPDSKLGSESGIGGVQPGAQERAVALNLGILTGVELGQHGLSHLGAKLWCGGHPRRAVGVRIIGEAGADKAPDDRRALLCGELHACRRGRQLHQFRGQVGSHCGQGEPVRRGSSAPRVPPVRRPTGVQHVQFSRGAWSHGVLLCDAQPALRRGHGCPRSTTLSDTLAAQARAVLLIRITGTPGPLLRRRASGGSCDARESLNSDGGRRSSDALFWLPSWYTSAEILVHSFRCRCRTIAVPCAFATKRGSVPRVEL